MSWVSALRTDPWAGVERLSRYAVRAGRALSSRVPATRKWFWEPWYDTAARHLGAQEDFLFINVGYAHPEDTVESLGLERPENLHRLSQQLYAHVVGDVDLRGREVLEVGCGRGGGSAFLLRQFQPRHLVAGDISQEAIDCCRRIHPLPGLTFQREDALKLSFGDERFDAVINVESSHCYLSRETFFREVYRVLKPGGYFLYTDVVYPELDGLTLEQVNAALGASGLVTRSTTDIAPHILKSRELAASTASFGRAVRAWARGSRLSEGLMRWVFFLPGTESYDSLRDGSLQYWSWKLQKPAS